MLFLWLVFVLVEVPMTAANEVTIGPGGLLVKDGKPVFVIGAYSPPKGEDLAVLSEMGFNLARIGAEPDQWKECRDAGLWMWHSFDLNLSGDQLKSKEESVRKVVEQLASDPGLLIWESVDEPAWTNGEPEKARVLPDPLIKGYRFLKSLDSHPVYLNHAPRNTVETLRKYNWAADIICVDVYPVIPRNMGESYAIIPPTSPGRVPRQTDLADLSPAVVGDYVDKMRKVAFHDQSVFVVLQGFSWEGLRKPEDRDPNLILYPTYDEFRFMAYQAIVHGVNGITVWGMSYNDNPESLSNISSVLNEIKEMSPFILGHRSGEIPTLRYLERGFGISKGIESLVTETEKAVTLFCVNATINPVTVRFTSLPAAFDGCGELQVLHEDRKVSLENGGFQDDFEGLGVHIYQYRR